MEVTPNILKKQWWKLLKLELKRTTVVVVFKENTQWEVSNLRDMVAAMVVNNHNIRWVVLKIHMLNQLMGRLQLMGRMLLNQPICKTNNHQTHMANQPTGNNHQLMLNLHTDNNDLF